MSKITQFEYQRKFNLGDYESETIGFVIVIDEDENENVEKLIDSAQKLAIKNCTSTKRKLQKKKQLEAQQKAARQAEVQDETQSDNCGER